MQAQTIRYEMNSENFNKIPGSPIAYWVSNNLMTDFQLGKRFELYGEPKSGVMTGDDAKFIRFWYEIDKSKLGLHIANHEQMIKSKLKWFPVTRGGQYRKWYGNIVEVVNLFNDGYDIKHNGKNYRLRDSKYYFKEGLTWTMITSYKFSVRIASEGVLFGNGGPTTFLEDDNIYYHLALLNSKISERITEIFNPTLNTVISDVRLIPVIFGNKDNIEKTSRQCTEISKYDWDSFETSWDFKKHPLI